MKVAIYARVSTEDQTEQNQVNLLEEWATCKGNEIYDVYRDIGSAWKANPDQSDQKELMRLFQDCDRGKVQMVMVYDLSRFTRRGPLELLLTLKRFADYRVQVNSYLETWFNVPSEFQPVLVSIWGYFAQLYSQQLSERTKAGMDRARAEGKQIGRPRKKGGKN